MEQQDVEALLDRFFAAIEAGDAGMVAELYAPDVLVWHSTTKKALGRDDSVALLAWLSSATQMRYEIAERLIVGDSVAQRHTVTVTVDGHPPLHLDTAIFFTVADGRITGIHEYVDAAGTRQLFEIVPPPQETPAG